MMLQRKQSMHVRITGEDRALFHYLYENKVALAVQIQRDIYPQHTLRGVNNRLAKMMQNGLVQGSQHRNLSSRLVYSLDRNGFKQFVRPTAVELKQELQSAAVGHDLDLVEIRRRLKVSAQVKSYYSENILKSGEIPQINDFMLLHDVRPDAILEIQLDQKVFLLPLEYEAARKYDSRYQELFGKYYRNKAIPGVLYICKDEELLKRVQKIEKRILDANKPKFYYSDFSKWKQGEPCLFTNLNGSSITLK